MSHDRSARHWRGVPAFVAIALSLAPEISAQTAPGPLEPAAPTPPAVYRSAFDGYRPFAEPKRIPWPEANTTAGRVGGHGGALKDAPDAPGTPPTGGGHKH